MIATPARLMTNVRMASAKAHPCSVTPQDHVRCLVNATLPLDNAPIPTSRITRLVMTITLVPKMIIAKPVSASQVL